MADEDKYFWKGRRILVVDDFEMVRSVVAKVMREIGCHEVHAAENGAEAYKKLVEALERNEPYDLVFSDWAMPVLNGLELFNKMAKHATLKNTAFVMFTIESDKNAVLTAAKAGIKHFMIKPLVKSALLEKLKVVEGDLNVEAKKRQYNL